MNKTIKDYLRHTEENSTGCMLWTRCLNTDGYPRANIRGNTNGKVHREVCSLHLGRDITGYVVRHTCDNPRCINPEHLVLGTATQNVQDRTERGRCHNHVSDEDLEIVKALREAGLTYKRISQILNIKIKRVEYIVKKKLNL